MGANDENFEKFRKANDENIKRAVHMAKIALGNKSEKIDKLLHDQKRMQQLTSKLSQKDMEKLEVMLQNPDNIVRLLQNDTVKQNIEKFLDEN